MKTKGLTLLHSSRQVEELFKADLSIWGKDSFFALTPEAMDMLDQHAVPYRIAEDECLDSLINIGRGNFDSTHRLCESVDRFLMTTSPTVQNLGLTPAFSHYYWLKILIDSITLRIHGLLQVINQVKPDGINFFESQATSITDELVFWDGSIFDLLVPLVSNSLGIPHRSLGTCDHHREKFKQPAFWKPAAKHLISITKTARRSLLSRLPTTILGPPKYPSNLPKILVASNWPELPYLIEANNNRPLMEFTFWNGRGQPSPISHSKECPNIVSLEKSQKLQLKQEGLKTWDAIKQEQWLPRSFSQDGVSFWDIIKPRIKYYFTNVLPKILETAIVTRTLIETYRPSAVVAGACYHPFTRTILNIAKSCEIPIIAFQHGGNYGYSQLPMHYYQDVAPSDYFSVYGTEVTNFFCSTISSYEQKARLMPPVGSPHLSFLKRSAENNVRPKTANSSKYKTTIMYVPTNMSGNLMYIPGTYPDTHYYQYQKRIIDILSKYPDVELVVKLSNDHPSRNPISKYIYRLKYPNVRTVSNKPFASFIGQADIYLFDWLSTAFLEALTTQSHVITIIDPRIYPLEEEAKNLLKKAVTYTEKLEDLPFDITSLLAGETTHKWSKASRQMFLSSYGIPKGSKLPADRAIDFINQVALQNVP